VLGVELAAPRAFIDFGQRLQERFAHLLGDVQGESLPVGAQCVRHGKQAFRPLAQWKCSPSLRGGRRTAQGTVHGVGKVVI
jgi:hypothetical protein